MWVVRLLRPSQPTLLSGVPTIDMCTLPVRVMRCLGVKMCIITNAAGGLNPNYNVGDILCVTDHFTIPNMGGKNCLVGQNDAALGPRFPPMSNAYDGKMQDIVTEASTSLGFNDFIRKSNTYCFVSGPMYETGAESKFLRSVGGDCFGMSTVPEVVAAHHAGIKVLCLSMITNKVVMPGDLNAVAASHQEVLDAVNVRSADMQLLVKDIVLKAKDYLGSIPDLDEVDLTLKPVKSKTAVIVKHVAVLAALVAIGFVAGQKKR